MLASWNGDYGNCITIGHGAGTMTLYGHLDSYFVARNSLYGIYNLVTFMDSHSGLGSYRLGVSDSSDTRPSSWSWVSCELSGGQSKKVGVDLSGYGVWYIHTECRDRVGLFSQVKDLRGNVISSVVVRGPYVVINELDKPAYRRWVYLLE